MFTVSFNFDSNMALGLGSLICVSYDHSENALFIKSSKNHNCIGYFKSQDLGIHSIEVGEFDYYDDNKFNDCLGADMALVYKMTLS